MSGLSEYLQCGINCIITAVEAATANPSNFIQILIDEIQCIFGCATTYLV